MNRTAKKKKILSDKSSTAEITASRAADYRRKTDTGVIHKRRPLFSAFFDSRSHVHFLAYPT